MNHFSRGLKNQCGLELKIILSIENSEEPFSLQLFYLIFNFYYIILISLLLIFLEPE